MFTSMTGPRARSAGVAALLALALFVAVAPGASLAATPSDPASVGAGADSELDAAGPGVEPAPIDADLEDADGTVTVLVRLEPFDEATTGAGEHAEREERDAIAARRAHAERTQRPLERYANETPGVTVDRGFWIANAALVTVDTDRAALADLARVEGVVGVEADERVALSSVGSADGSAVRGQGHAEMRPAAAASGTSSPKFTNGLETVRVPEAWDGFHTRGEGVTVAVLDSGVDGDHPDLEVAGWKDFSSDPSPEPVDYDGHGTRTSGIVAGGDASGEHIGVAPDATLLHGAVATDCAGRDRCTGTSSTVLAGIEWALAEDADVISLSLGWRNPGRATIDALENAEDVGAVVGAGIGNDGEGASLAPGNAYSAIGVGAVDRSEGVLSFSGGEEIDTAARWGPNAPAHWPDAYVAPDVVAPGTAVKTADAGGGYDRGSGTSLAAPYVTGAAALVQSATADDLEPAAIKRALEETARKPADAPAEKDTRYGSGIVDAYAAIDAAGEHATLEGRVTDAETGAPIPDASVEVVAGGEVYERSTDSDGRFELTGLAGDREYVVTVNRTGYESTTETRRLPADETTSIDVALAGAGTIDVGLRDAHFGDGIDAATVEAIGPRGTYSATHVGGGTYRLENVPTDVEYEVRASAPGYVEDETSVSVTDASAPVAESMTLSGDAALAVAVETEDGDPIPNAIVSVSRARRDGASFDAPGTTGDDGTLEVAVPGTGESYAVDAAAPEAAFESNGVETDPVESAETVAATVTLSEPASIPGFGVSAAVIAVIVGVLTATARERGAGRRPK